MFQLNFYKKQRIIFHEKMFKKPIIQITKIKKENDINKNFFKTFFLIFFSIIHFFLICDFLCEGEFSQEKEIEDFNYLKMYYNDDEDQENCSNSNNSFFLYFD